MFGLGRLWSRDAAYLHLGTRNARLSTLREELGLLDFADHDAQQACVALQSLLGEARRKDVSVQVSCAWTRLLMLPWMEHLTSQDRWLNYARARFEQVYAESAADWDVHVGRDMPGKSRVAAAWPQGMRQTLAQSRSVKSVRIALLEHLGVLLEHEPAFSGCVAEVDTDSAGFLLVLGGEVRRIRWSRYDHVDGLVTAVRSEWASVIGEGSVPAAESLGLALAPPAPEPGSTRSLAVTALASGLGFRRAFSLPDWP